nr:MAK10-like protein [Tanacetum cinerariifolium]
MGDVNPICTLGDYSKPSHEGYRNTIELPVGNNVVPLQSDTIRLVQNGCSFHELWFEDPNQHLKDFLKLTDSLDLNGNLTTQMNFASTNCPTTKELRSKGVKSPLKLLSLKCLSQSSIAEQNRNPLSSKRVYFVNSIFIQNKEDEAKDKYGEKSTITDYKGHKKLIEIE